MALQQKINISDIIKVNADGTLGQFTVSYESTDSITGDPITTSTNLGSSLYFNSSELDLITISEIYRTGLKFPNPSSSTFPGDSRPDESNLDEDNTTDQLFLATWNDPNNWQGNSSNFQLYTAIFQITPGVDNPTLNLVAVPSNGANPVETIIPTSFTTVTNEIPTVTAKDFSIARSDIPANQGFFTSVIVADGDDAINTLGVNLVNGNFDTDGDGNNAFTPALSFTNGTWNLVVNDRDDLTDTSVTTFDLTVEATDSLQESSTGVVSVTITDAPPPEPPVVTGKSLTILGNEITKYSKLANGDTFTTVNVTDANDEISTLTVEIAGGNLDADGDGNSAFAPALTFANGTWNIVVNDADDLNFANSTGYTLDIQATDTAGTSGNADVTVAITDKFQRLNVSPEPLRIKSDGTTLEFTVQYESSDSTVGSFGAGLYFDSSALDLNPVQQADILGTNRTFPNSFPADSRADESDNDQDSNTDQLFLTAWADGTQNWPGTTPIDLYNVTFDVAEGFTGSTPVNFTVNPANGFVADVPRFDVTVNSVPVFGQDAFTFTIDEGSAVGTNVGTPLTATDADNDALTYSIVGGNTDVDGDTNLAFTIDPTTGQIKVNDADDLVFGTNFSLSVHSTDILGEFDTATVAINLNDVGGPINEAPVFEQTFGPFTIKEASPVGTTVGTVFAVDPEGDTLTYSLVGGNDDIDGDGNFAFTINSSGLITVNDSDDLKFNTKPNFGLSVQASDGQETATTAVTVNLEKLPNQTPFFDRTFNFEVGEVSANDTFVGQLLATDPEGEALTYNIVGGNTDIDGDGESAFTIDSANGQITVNDFGDILASNSSPEFNLLISAVDPAGAEASTVASVDVTRNGIYQLDAGDRLEVSDVKSASSLYNLVTFYRVDSLNGEITEDGQTYKPGDSGYLTQALLRAEQDVLIRGQGESSNTIEGNGASFTSATDGFYAPMLIANGGNLNDVLDVLEVNASNTIGSDISKIAAYFAFGAANATNDGEKSSGHFRSSGDTLFIEDLHSAVRGSGEPDYNDLSFTVNIV